MKCPICGKKLVEQGAKVEIYPEVRGAIKKYDVYANGFVCQGCSVVFIKKA